MTDNPLPSLDGPAALLADGFLGARYSRTRFGQLTLAEISTPGRARILAVTDGTRTGPEVHFYCAGGVPLGWRGLRDGGWIG